MSGQGHLDMMTYRIHLDVCSSLLKKKTVYLRRGVCERGTRRRRWVDWTEDAEEGQHHISYHETSSSMMTKRRIGTLQMYDSCFLSGYDRDREKSLKG